MLFPIDLRYLGLPQVDSFSGLLFVAAFLVVAVLGAVRPAFAIAALIVIDPFDHTRYLGTTLITFPKIAVLGALAGLIVHYIRKPGARASWRDVRGIRLLIFALLALIGATAITYFQASLWWAWRDEMFKLCDDAAIFVAALAAGIADDDLGPIEIAVGIGLLLVAGLALPEESTARSVVAMSGSLVPRVAGPLEGPNQLAGFLQIVIPTLAAFAMFRRPRLWVLAALFVGALVDVLTLSRNGLACCAIATAIVVALGPGKRFVVAFALLAGCACGIAVQPAAIFRLTTTSQSENAGSVGTRAILWRAAISLWRMHPFWGVGAGNFEFEIWRVGPAGVRTHANDWYLQALTEGGIPLAAATLFTVYASIASFARGLREDPLVLSAFAVSIGLALGSILDYVLFYPKVIDMWWLLLGLASARQVVRARLPQRAAEPSE